MRETVGAVLRPGVKPIVARENGHLVYRFNTGYLNRLLENFPDAELAPSVSREVSAQPGAARELCIPGLKTKLYPYQVEAVWKVSQNPSYLLFFEMGLGKTVVSLASLKYEGAFPALVVCPNSVRDVWKNQAEQHFDGITCSVVEPGKAKHLRANQIKAGTDLVVINWEALRLFSEELGAVQWKALVMDEFHRIATPTAQVTQATHKLARIPKKIGLSGTPSRNGRYEEFWSPLKMCWPEDWPNYHAYLSRYTVRHTINGRARIVVGYRTATADIDAFLDTHASRLKKSDVLKDLPPVVQTIRYVDLTKEQKQVYKQIKDDFLLQLDNGEIKDVPTALSQLTRLKQACFSPELFGGVSVSSKADEISDVVTELLMGGNKVIVFSQWSRVTNIIKRELAKVPAVTGGHPAHTEGASPIAYVDGKVPTKQRTLEIERFQTDPETKVFIGTYGSCREGITLTAASYVILADMPWTPADVDQAISRAHRIGQKGTVTAIEIRARGTVEEGIAGLLERKRESLAWMVDREKYDRPSRKIFDQIKDLLHA